MLLVMFCISIRFLYWCSFVFSCPKFRSQPTGSSSTLIPFWPSRCIYRLHEALSLAAYSLTVQLAMREGDIGYTLDWLALI